MTVDFQKEAIQLRSELAMIRGLLHQMPSKLEPFPFTNLVQNGGFDVGVTGWTPGNGATLTTASGQLQITSSGSGYGQAKTQIGTVTGRRYAVTATRSNGYIGVGSTDGAVNLYNNGYSAAPVDGAFTTTGSMVHVLLQNDSTASVARTWDNVSLWEADPADDAPWLRLPFGYSVKECGGFVVRDGDILHPPEWEEINRCGQRFIKPLVAPGHDTDFLIFAGVAK